jgi:transcription-repair coupling factor (superfamily II helicase)
VIPMPRAGDERVSDADLIAWVRQLLDQLFPQPAAATAGPAPENAPT